MTLRVFATNDFTGHWAVGAAAVVVAESIEHARVLLNAELHKEGLKLLDEDKVVEIDLVRPSVWVLVNGEY